MGCGLLPSVLAVFFCLPLTSGLDRYKVQLIAVVCHESNENIFECLQLIASNNVDSASKHVFDVAISPILHSWTGYLERRGEQHLSATLQTYEAALLHILISKPIFSPAQLRNVLPWYRQDQRQWQWQWLLFGAVSVLRSSHESRCASSTD